MKIQILPLSLMALSLAAVAEEESPKRSTDIEVGIISTSGNTETTTLKAKLDLRHDLERFKNQFIIEGLYAENQVAITEEDGSTRNETQTTAERYALSNKTDFKLNEEHRSLFGFVSYEQDEFSGFEYQASFAVGYADRFFTKDNSYWSYSVGPGMLFNETEDTIVDGEVVTEGESNSTGIVRLATEYVYKFNDNAKFTQTLASDVPFESDQNQRTSSVTAITANIVEGLALKASLTINNNSEAPEGRENTDTQTAVTVVYSF
jgi:putative salt-induced outer membrane protein YdiY